MIQVELVETTLNQATFYTGRIKQSGTFTPDELAQEIAARNIAAPETVRAVIDALDDVILSALLRGERVYLAGLLQLYLTIGGKFDAPDDSLADSKNELGVASTLEAQFIERLRQSAELHNAGTSNLNPMPQVLTGIHCALGELRAGDVVQITGNRLYFHQGTQGEGVDFVPTGAGSIVHAPNTFDSGEKKVNVFTPVGLAPGAIYVIRVSGRARNRTTEAQLRSGTSTQTITTAP